MKLIFVSQCEKKALKRTRQILDAFADRIGDHVWETMMTAEGLKMVQSLLKKTATKNTAVSCRWIRSRRRTDLLWIVGNRNKFNQEGKVPVNRTEQKIIQPEFMMNTNKNGHYANTNQQSLSQHLFAVGYLSAALFNKTVNNEEKKNLSVIAYLSGCFHDLGKLDPCFQSWVQKGKQKNQDEDGFHIDSKFDKKDFTFENHPRHNEISAIILYLFVDQLKGLNFTQINALLHCVYWHHAKPFRKNKDFDDVVKSFEYLQKNVSITTLKSLFSDCISLLKEVNAIAEKYEFKNNLSSALEWTIFDIDEQLEKFESQCKNEYPEFKSYSVLDDFIKLRTKIDKNAQNNLLRACVISADRMISKLSASDLNDYIDQNRLAELIEAIDDSSSLEMNLEQFQFLPRINPASERTIKQNQIAQRLTQIRDVPVLAGAAGCGKTRIALEWARLKKAKKIIWICPRVQVCQGIFQELIDDYLPDAKIEIFTGEFKYTNRWEKVTKEADYFTGDVVVTTIDQIVGSIVSHSNVDNLIPFMEAYVVFDEYHEYINMNIFNLLFAELVANKNMKDRYDKRILLVSATPHYAYLSQLLNIQENDIIECPSFNDRMYQLNFIDYDDSSKENNPFFKAYNENIIIISNTAQTAQLSYIYQQKNENGILFHSKFKKSDKKIIFESVYESFKKAGSRKYQVLRSGPIVQASLNITSDLMLTEMTSPENMLQRLGRLDRFGENENINVLSVAITESVKLGKSKGSSSYFLNSLNLLQTTKQWFDFLQFELKETPFNLPYLYDLYKRFYKTEQGKCASEDDLMKSLKQSIILIADKVSEPRMIVKSKLKEMQKKLSKNSLRGDSRFIQLAVLNVDNYEAPIFENRYAYESPFDDFVEYDNLTESLCTIRELGLIDHMALKHGRIDPAHPVSDIPSKKSSLRKSMIENSAIKVEYPIYLSYIPADLDEKLSGESDRNPHAIYYAVCDKQAIGTLSLQKLNEVLNNKEKL